MNAGDITGMQVYINEAGSLAQDLIIRMAVAPADTFNSHFYTADWTTVYHNDVLPFFTGWANVAFTAAYSWDGTSDILVEVTYANEAGADDTWLRASDAGANRSIYASSSDRYLDLWNPVYAAVDGTPYNSLDQQITVSFWTYGDPVYQPQSGTTFEIRDDNAYRVVNVHGPWGDGVFYWDAGNDGGGSYDRINKAAAVADYEGNWTHWAFTKDASTGDMKIYKNGVLWHSGTDKTRSMAGGTEMRIGKGLWAGSQSYYGWMDEFAMWDAVLDEATIQEYLYKDLDEAHPNADDLILYYSFNDGDGIYESDASSSNADLALIGAVSRPYDPATLFRYTTMSNLRPDVIWEQGVFTSHLDSVLVIDTVLMDPVTLVTFDPADPTSGLDTILVWPGDVYTYLYDEYGVVADSVLVPATDNIAVEYYEYYSAPFEVVNRYELGRYITPYGIGLDLGDGFTWTFDVSDYRPLLHDSVRLAAGNWQELLDMQLWFIEGTPPRDPISVTNLWTGYKGYNTDEAFDDNTPAITMNLPADASEFRIKSRVSGHGFGGTANCAEFCAKEHYFKVNDDVVWTREVWRDNCDLNPVYPQGGTWVYDRANWCPGAEVWTYDFELTPFVTPGSTYTFDYAAEDYNWNGSGSFPYYQTEVQLVAYGPYNFDLDAAVTDILAPSGDDMWGRMNPICNNPIIRIQNTGASTLTSLKVEFGLKDAPYSTYNWSGELQPMEWEEVTLPDYVYQPADQFVVTISEPNGGADEYELNNTMTSEVAFPVSYPADLIIEFKANNKPNENDWFVYDANGNELYSRTTFTAGTIHKDTIHLEDGCYEFYLWDWDEDGISWWANSDGTGYLRIKDANTGTILKSFEPDFGGLIYQQFTVGTYVDIDEPLDAEDAFEVYPNPAADHLYLKIRLSGRREAEVFIYDYAGNLIHTEKPGRIQDETLHMDVSQYASGMYVAVLKAGNTWKKVPFMVE
ncbi:MAG: T9SS type A sorting domain-containing protein [Chitinophagales bacterium]|nr:T9SS type A sorting domain-containing protein [Chitinophagales bacterium]MCB9022842.1 T9SS type A sorting domain-containing protein [Chitinophagales bacterium]HPE98115.1 peptide-N-glycosidase F-related protein [Chitinophagales bacterium]